MSGFRFFGVGVGSNYFTYPVKLVSNNTNSLAKILIGKSLISKLLLASTNTKLVVFYKFNLFFYLNKIFHSLFDPLLVKIETSVSSLASKHLGFDSAKNPFLSALTYSIGFNTDFEYRPFLYQGHHGNSNTTSSYVVIPTTVFVEKNSSFLNLEGIVQKSHAAVSPSLLVKRDEEIFKALTELNSLLVFDSSFLLFKNFYSLINLDSSFFFKLPYWVSNTLYYSSHKKNVKLLKNYMFTLKILNYYWNDILSQNSKIMAKCASLLTNNNITYK
jgi:NADH dehydrogenase/NADH:ubiquinone oxidoreductase subunit G